MALAIQKHIKPKVVFVVVFAIILSALSSCQAPTDTARDAKIDENSRNITPFLSVLQAFYCKPDNSVFVAAHRGTQKNSPYPENSLEGLKALYAKGIIFAEIDIARLKDDTLILYHDGVWERGSTGTGPVATTDWAKSQTYLLKDTRGTISAYRPSRLKEVLTWAKDKMYLEIDFKSSVSEAKVIDAIRSANMLNQTILISYNPKQAVRLHKLAPNAAISVSLRKPGDIKALEIRGLPINVMTAWTGKTPISKNLRATLRKHHIPILTPRFSHQEKQLHSLKESKQYKLYADSIDLLVTDYAFDAQQVFDFTLENTTSYEKCAARFSSNTIK